MVSLLAALLVVALLPGCKVFPGGDNGVWSSSAANGLGWLTQDSSDAPDVEGASVQVAKLSTHVKQTVRVAIKFHYVTPEQIDEAMWQRLDESVITPGVRNAWLSNGLRIGVLSPTQSLAFMDDSSVDGQDPVTSLMAGVDVLGQQSGRTETIPLRPGHRHELPLAPGFEGERTVLLNQNRPLVAGNDVIGRSLLSPQFLLEMIAHVGPREGQAMLSLTPEIQYGPLRQQFVHSDNAMRMHAGRDRWTLDEFAFDWQARPGETLVITPAVETGTTEPTFGLGRQMLQDRKHLNGSHHIVACLTLLDVDTPASLVD